MDLQPPVSGRTKSDPADSESLADVTDLIERNVLPESVETTLRSTIQEPGREVKPALVIITNQQELLDIFASTRQELAKSGNANTMHFSRDNLPSLTLFRTFNQSILPELAPEKIAFVESVNRQVILHYPVQYVLGTAEGLYIDEDDSQKVPDGYGYPAFFPRTAGHLQVRGRVSLTQYPANVNPSALAKITGLYDMSTAKAYASIFQLRNDEDGMWLIRNRVRSAVVGDNHLALLLRAFMYYFDSLHLVQTGTVAKRNGQRTLGVSYNIRKDTGWVGSIADGSKEIVNCLGMPHDYCQFWAYCCLPSNECYVEFETSAGQTLATPFSLFHSKIMTKMSVIAECSVVMGTAIPSWFHRPEFILSYIEMHVRRFGLHQQANDACSIAQLLPVIRALDLPISVPEPLHSCDWFEGQIGHIDEPLAITHLSGAGHLQTLAALHATPIVLEATLYDIQSTLLMHRAQYPVTTNEKLGVDGFFGRMISDPGAVPRFLLQRCLGLSHTLVPLLGWDRSFAPIQNLLPKDYESCPLPIHILHLQRISGIGSVRTSLPYSVSTKWSITVNNNILRSSFNTFMALKRCGALGAKNRSQSYEELTKDVLPLMTPDRSFAVTLSPQLSAKVRHLATMAVTLQFCKKFSEHETMPWTIAQPDLHHLMARWESDLGVGHTRSEELSGDVSGRVTQGSAESRHEELISAP